MDLTEPAPASDEATQQPAPSRNLLSRRSAQLLRPALVVGALVGWLIAGYQLLPREKAAATFKPVLEQPRWVLIADVDSQSARPGFDSVIRRFLQLEITNSTNFRTVARSRVDDALRRMRAPANAPINRERGLEIVVRDSDIQLLIIPGVQTLGSDYLLTLEALHPETGLTIVSRSEEATSPGHLMAAAKNLVNGLSDQLAQRLPPHQDHLSYLPELKPVTTNSLGALRLYTLAERNLEEGNLAIAGELLLQAVSEDPEFASAHAHLAWSLRRRGTPPDKYLAEAARAVALADVTLESERYFILATQYHLTGQWEKALASYQVLLSLAPDHQWALHYAHALCAEQLGLKSCTRLETRLADGRPEDFDSNYRAAWTLALDDAPAERIETYAWRARQLVATTPGQYDPQASARVLLLGAFRHWLAGDTATALDEEQRILRTTQNWPGFLRDRIAGELGTLNLALGRLDAAVVWFNRISDSTMQHELLAHVAFARGDMEQLRWHLAERSAYREPFTAILMSVAGLPGRAEGLIQSLRKRGVPSDRLQMARARLAMARDKTTVPVSQLQEAARRLNPIRPTEFFLASDLLAMMLVRQDRLREAIDTLEATTLRRTEATYLGAGALWTICQLRLARLYREIARPEDAERIEASLRGLLVSADADHPVLLELAGTPTALPTAPAN
jgi:tetratricopeptide (TPR) repeat protein